MSDVRIYLDSLPKGQYVELSTQPGAAFASCDASCPHCGAGPLKVYGTDAQWATDTTLEAFGFCFDCKKSVGLVEAVVGHTIFGTTEDAAVRAEIEERGGRVYDGA